MSRVAEYFSMWRNIGYGNGSTTSHGLEWRKTEAFVDRGIDKSRRAGVKSRKRLVLDTAKQANSFWQGTK